MIAHAITVPPVPPIVRVAQTYMGKTARAAGDGTPSAGYSWSPDELTAGAYGEAAERGRLRPARIAGVQDWTCGAALASARRITCRLTITSDAWSVTVKYSARRGRAEISMTLVAK